jgi:hypothetical protein
MELDRSGSCTRTWTTSPHVPHSPEPIAIICAARQGLQPLEPRQGRYDNSPG